ncbi:DUF1236 domain-containing protein [Flaviflagellibacter deserti]|uniref:DUF1236 domain-containing protein n=1 Tax=Flaviflagellibacter deserti TaxID=2267266 RepID=A0ABV9Z3S6_9HYPH
MKTILLNTAAAAALLIGISAASAQTDAGGAAGGASVPPPAASGGAGAAGGAAGGAGMKGGADASGGASAQNPMPRNDASSAAGTPSETGGGNRAATEPTQKNAQGQGEMKSGAGKSAAEGKTDTNKSSAEGKADANKSSAEGSKQGGMESGRAAASKEITTEQKTTIRQKISTTNVQKVNVDFNVSVGAAVPRHVHVMPLPPTIVEVVPQYQGYSYIVLADGRIVIIDPSSYAIVTIIAV